MKSSAPLFKIFDTLIVFLTNNMSDLYFEEDSALQIAFLIMKKMRMRTVMMSMSDMFWLLWAGILIQGGRKEVKKVITLFNLLFFAHQLKGITCPHLL